MPEEGEFELFTGPAPKEKDEMGDEQFRDEMKRTQQALAQLQKEEGKAKANDRKLAQILIQFLSQPENTDLFLLISRTVAQNIPSELILAVISLIDKKASEEIKGYLESSEKIPSAESKALTVAENKDFHSLSPDQKKSVDNWISTINKVAFKKPHRILEALVINKRAEEQSNQIVREISPALVQLSAFIFRNYLTSQNVTFEFSRLKEFMQTVFVKLVKDLETLVKEQKQLKRED
jgi:mRNA-degrading endonuclease HigB of HigAB toxin-antitoxin module